MKDSVKLLQRIRDYLEAEGIGTKPNPTTGVVGDLFIQALPDDVENGVVVAHTGGIDLADDPTRRPTFTVQVRNKRGQEGLTKAVAIARLFDNQWNTLSGFPARLTTVVEPGAYFKDDAGRYIYFINVELVTTTQV